MHKDENLIGAVDIGGTKVAIGLVSRKGLVVCRRTLQTGELPNGEVALVAIRSALNDCLAEAGGAIDGIGVSCTGPIDPVTGIVGRVSNLPRGWEGWRLVDQLGAAFTTRTIMENDADAAALAEFAWGCGRGVDRFLYITISTGIGAGFIVDGELYRGAGGSHAEMGHHGIDPAGPECYCGARGCWESLASGIAIKDWFLKHDPVERFSATPFSAETIFALNDAGDPIAKQAVERLARYVGIGLSNLTTILVPDVIAIGGGIALRADVFLGPAIEKVRCACGEVPTERVVIRTASLRKDVDLAGAAAAWIHTFERPRIVRKHSWTK